LIELVTIPGKTGNLLRTMLQERNLLGTPYQGRVNYGYGRGHLGSLPTLNARAGTFNKYEELVRLHKAGVQTVPFSPYDMKETTFGRRFHHTRGNDIRIIDGNYRVPPRGFSDYYTQLIPKRREFRVWAFRRTCIGVYEKVLSYPRKNGRRGRSKEVWNWRNGYAYEFRRASEMAPPLRTLGWQAVDALGLDFGAVDIIESVDQRYYVLEVNSAPGTEGPRQGLTSLVNHIERWARGGFKRRNGDGEPSTAGSGNRG
jgi:hypothetical protein